MPLLLTMPEQDTYWCKKCNTKTSGVFIPPSTERVCLICKSPLIKCEHCGTKTSSTKKDNLLVCDQCKQTINPQQNESNV